MDHLDAQRARERRPLLARLRVGLVAGVLRDVEQRLLDEVRDQPGVGAVGDHGRGAVGPGLAQLENFLAQGIIGAAAGRDVRVGIAARPWLDAGVEVQRPLLVAELDQRDAGDVHRQVQQEVAAAHQRVQHVAEVLARERVVQELDSVLLRLLAPGVVGRDDRDAVGREPADVAQDQRQDALADGTEADENQPPGEMRVYDVLGHQGAECTVI